MRTDRLVSAAAARPALSCRRGERTGLLAGTCLFVLATGGGHAAQPFRETFATNLSGWTSSAGPAWVFTNGTAGVSFGAQGFFFPETATLVASNAASGGAFTGDYGSAGLQAIGIDLLAMDALPLSVTLDLYSGTNLFFRALPVAGLATGVWRTFVVNVETKAGGGWLGGNEAAFAAARTNVTHLRLRIDRSGVAAQRYRVDNVVLAVPPRASGIALAGETIQVAWTNLIVGARYRCEGASDLPAGDWAACANFTAASESTSLTLPATNPAPEMLRLTGE